MTGEVESAWWTEEDHWWDVFIKTTSSVLQPELATITEDKDFVKNWNCVDSWWETNIKSQRDALVKLQEVLEEAQTAWVASESHFDSDLLTTDWTSNTGTAGPLRTNQEENWSQWIAHLIRTGPREFSQALFGDNLHTIPRSVEREVHLPDHDEPDRYADVLAFYDGQSISIEVKKGDEHYGKTIHTASLIESQFREDWHHVLLLPASKQKALRQSFGEQLLETNGGTKIGSEQSTDIEVIHWLDVGRAIREILLSDIDGDAHWEASAYLFCTLIEQKLARFVPKPVLDRTLDSKDVVQTVSSTLIDGHDVDEQIAYLRETTTN